MLSATSCMLRVRPVTGTYALVTSTSQEPYTPFGDSARTVAEPAATAVTLPLPSTVATEVLRLFQVTVLSVALEGSTVAERV